MNKITFPLKQRMQGAAVADLQDAGILQTVMRADVAAHNASPDAQKASTMRGNFEGRAALIAERQQLIQQELELCTLV